MFVYIMFVYIVMIYNILSVIGSCLIKQSTWSTRPVPVFDFDMLRYRLTYYSSFLPQIMVSSGSLDTVFLQHLQLPEEARELDKELRQITKDKNEAVRSQDFEKVVLLLCFLH